MGEVFDAQNISHTLNIDLIFLSNLNEYDRSETLLLIMNQTEFRFVHSFIRNTEEINSILSKIIYLI